MLPAAHHLFRRAPAAAQAPYRTEVRCPVAPPAIDPYSGSRTQDGLLAPPPKPCAALERPTGSLRPRLAASDRNTGTRRAPCWEARFRREGHLSIRHFEGVEMSVAPMFLYELSSRAAFWLSCPRASPSRRLQATHSRIETRNKDECRKSRSRSNDRNSANWNRSSRSHTLARTSAMDPQNGGPEGSRQLRVVGGIPCLQAAPVRENTPPPLRGRFRNQGRRDPSRDRPRGSSHWRAFSAAKRAANVVRNLRAPFASAIRGQARVAAIILGSGRFTRAREDPTPSRSLVTPERQPYPRKPSRSGRDVDSLQ